MKNENIEIIDLVVRLNMKPAQIAEELHNKYAPDVSLKVYKMRIKKRVQRLKAKGLLEPVNNTDDNTNHIMLSAIDQMRLKRLSKHFDINDNEMIKRLIGNGYNSLMPKKHQFEVRLSTTDLMKLNELSERYEIGYNNLLGLLIRNEYKHI